MTQTQNRFFDDVAKMMTNAAGAAQGMRREVEVVVKGQIERLVADMDLVPREEFDAVREMATLARAENDRLSERLDALEAELARLKSSDSGATTS